MYKNKFLSLLLVFSLVICGTMGTGKGAKAEENVTTEESGSVEEEEPCEEPEEDIQDTVKTLANNYFKHLDGIIDFMLPDIKEIYGQVTVEDVKRNLGRPIVDYDNGKVTYCEQSFDDCHIFEFEFMDDAFEKLQYFSIDG